MSAVIEPGVREDRNVVLVAGDASRTIAIGGREGTVTADRFQRQVRALAARLPDASHAINLCEDRYRFLLAFCAAAVRGQATLLPPSRAPQALADVQCLHPGAWCLGDAGAPAGGLRYWPLPERLPEEDGEPLVVSPSALAVVGFTSGSTGAPAANPKTWASFHASTALNLAALRHLWQGAPPPHCASGTQPPTPPITGASFRQQTRPGSQLPATPPMQEHPSPVQFWGRHWKPPWTAVQRRPASQELGSWKSHSQPWLLQAGGLSQTSLPLQ